MTRTNLLTKVKFFAFALIANFTTILANAQDGAADLKVDVDINKGGELGDGWMSNPLVWVIGALVLIVIIALVARGGGNND